MDISNYVMIGMLAFTRIAAFLFLVPFLKTRMIPATAKIAVAGSIAIAVLPQMKELHVTNVPEFVGLLMVQFLIGATLAFVVEIVFSAIQIAGGIVDIDTGFSAVTLMDPSSNQQSTIFSNLFVTLFTVIFISAGGIDSLIYGIVYSFKFTTVDYFLSNPSFYQMMMDLFLYMFTAAVQISLPLTMTLFIINFLIMIIGKTAPQVNIFSSMFIIKIAVCFIFLYITLPFIGEVFSQINDTLMDKFINAIDAIHHK